MEPREHGRDFRIGLSVFADEPVVGIFRELLGNSQGRFVDPHEVIVADHERHPQDRFGEDPGCFRPLGLGFESLARPVDRGESGVQRGERPLGGHHRPAAHFIKPLEFLAKRLAGEGAVVVHGDAVVQVDVAVVVEGNDVAVLPGLSPGPLGSVSSGEAATEDHVVRIAAANGRGGDFEIAACGRRDERLLIGGRRRGGVRKRITPE